MDQDRDQAPWPPGGLRIAGWHVQPTALRISRDGIEVRLEPKVMQLLLCLARRPGETVTRAELEEAVWPDVTVGYDALATSVSKLRDAFGDRERPPCVIETVPKTGYRLIAPVEAGVLQPLPDRPGWKISRVLAMAAATMLVALAVLLWSLLFRPVAPPNETAVPTVAVLALDNLTGDPEQDVWSDGLSESIISELSRFHDFDVIARHSSFVYKGKAIDVRQIRKELGADYVLEGSFRRDGDEVRVTAQLIDAATGKHVWAETYTRGLESMYQVEAEIVGPLVATLGGQLDVIGRNKASAASDLRNPEAYLLQERGRAVWHRWTREANASAAELFRQALAIDPDYASAYRSLAWVYINENRYGWGETRGQSLALAYEAVEKALALAPFDHRVHWTRGAVNMRAGELERALVDYEKALDLNPNAADVLADMSVPLTYLGRFDEAIAALERGMRLNPLYPYWYAWNLSWTLYSAGRPEEAIHAFSRMSYVPPRARTTLAAAKARIGRLDEARAEMARFLQSEPDHTLREEAATLAPFRDLALRQRWLDDLRAAGLPD